MSELTTVHPDEFALLRYAACELSADDRRSIDTHVQSCGPCSRRLDRTFALDTALREVADCGALAITDDDEMSQLPLGDPFRQRPEYPAFVPRRAGDALHFAAFARDASDRSLALRESLRAAMPDPKTLSGLLGNLALSDPAARYAILYAMQDSGREIASSPVAALRFAEQVLERLRKSSSGSGEDADVEALVPLLMLRGQAHLLAGQACNWIAQFDQAKTHLRLAYRSFGKAGGDEIGLAIVEHVEAQRRFLLDRGAEALVLAKRAKASFESFGIEDLTAKADVAVGTALGKMGREAEAIPLLYSALAVFERRGIWSNYVATLSNLCTILQKVGRLDDAKREYARAIRRVPPESSGLYLAIIRHGLAEVLFLGQRYREAAASFSRASRLAADHGLTANSLDASLFEIESWARSGDISRARHRLELFQERVAGTCGLDPHVLAGIQNALAGSTPDLETLSDLRQRAGTDVHERLRLIPA